MLSFNLSELGDQLKNATLNSTGSGVSFAKEALKLDTEEDALEIVKAIKACTKLEYLDLEGNTLGPLAAKAVAEALKENGALLQRALWKDMFTGRLKTEIPQALEHLGTALCTAGTRLVELDLSDNAFGPIAVKKLAILLTSPSCYTLRELKMNNNGLGIAGGKLLAKALLDCYENSSRSGNPPLALRVFIAGRNRLENEGAIALAAVFKTLTSLEEVSMPQNSIYYPGIEALASGLSANPGLRILNLNDNTIGHKGAKALAEALPNCQNLEQLNLGDCLLKTRGSLFLTETLALEGNHPALAKLNLSYNEITKKGATSIALAVADKKSLTSLELGGNAFGAEGRALLRQSLTQSNRIESLDSLSDDESDDESGKEKGDSETEGETEDEEVDENEDDKDDDDDEEEEEEDIVENGETPLQSSVGRANVTIAEFMKSPAGEKLLLLQSDSAQDFTDYARSVAKATDVSPDLKFIEEFTRTIMKVSTYCGSGYGDVRSKAESLTDDLYAKLFSLAAENDQVSVWNNSLLVNLGLIKSEDKRSGKIDWDLEGCFKALEKVTQRDYFLAQTRNTLKFFLEKPVKISRAKVVDPFQDSKDSLRNVLHRIQAT